MTELPPLEGCYHCSYEKVHTGYNTDLEEMDSWEEQEEVFLIFSPEGEVRTLIAPEDASYLDNAKALERELSRQSQSKAGGNWEYRQLDGRSGYLLTLKLPYNVPVFWQSTSPDTVLFLEPDTEGITAQRYYPLGGWGSETRKLTKR